MKKPIDMLMVERLYSESGSVRRVGEQLGVCAQTIKNWLNAKGRRLHASHWSESELNTLRSAYAQAGARVDLRRLARTLCRPYAGVALKASRLGLGDASRSKTPRRKASPPTPLLPWPRWVKHQHPRGMAGKHHNATTKAVIASKGREYWDRCKHTKTGIMSLENSQRRSDAMLQRTRLFGGQPAYTRCRGGRRADLDNRYFRSAWEANIARYLNWLVGRGEIQSWDYEAETFIFEKISRGSRSYIPDFKVVKRNGDIYYIEVKGWMDQKSKTKLARMARYYPEVKIELIGAERYRAIQNTVGGLLPHWERKGRTTATSG